MRDDETAKARLVFNRRLVGVCVVSGLLASLIGGLGLSAGLERGSLTEPSHWSPGLVLSYLALLPAPLVPLLARRWVSRGRPRRAAVGLLVLPLVSALLWLRLGYGYQLLLAFAPWLLGALAVALVGPRCSPTLAAAVVALAAAMACRDFCRITCSSGCARPSGRRHPAVEAARLIEWGVDPDVPGEGGVTPLMLAVEANDEVLVRLLLSEGASTRQQDDRGATAGSRALAGGHPRLVVLMLEAEGRARAQDGRVRAGAASAGGGPMSERRRSWRRRLAFTAALTLLGVAVCLPDLVSVQRRLAATRIAAAQAESDLAALPSDSRQAVRDYKAQKALLEHEISVVGELRRSDPHPDRLLALLFEQAPQGLTLRQVVLDGNRLSLALDSSDEGLAARFAQRLAADPRLEQVDLHAAQRPEEPAGRYYLGARWNPRAPS